MHSKILALHAEMKELTLQFAKVSEKAYDAVVAKVDLFNDAELDLMLQWLAGVYKGRYREVKKIYQMPANYKVAWKMYECQGITGLQEQILMANAASLLGAIWRLPYKPVRVIRRKHEKATTEQENDSGHSDGVCVRPESGRTDEGNP